MKMRSAIDAGPAIINRGLSDPVTTTAETLAERLNAELAPELRVLRPLGEGAAALVYLAGEPALERLVAVKVLRPELSADEVVRRRFDREARAAARIRHPNVVAIHRVGVLEDELPFILMEYVEGRTLEDVLAAKSPFELERAGRVLAQIASALGAAHEKRIIHRDVRPGNVLLEDDTDRVVLTDFGIAGIKETGSELVTRLTRANDVLGDPRYASPEQLLGEPVTEAADVYSFGVIAHEVLAGQSPFSAVSAREMAAAHLQQVPRNLLATGAEVPPELAILVDRCLAKKPEQRPRAREVAETLAATPLSSGTELRALQDGRVTSAAEQEPPFFPAVGSFLAELRRRRVYRAAASYLAASFILLQGADLVLPALSVQAWVYPVLVTVALGGFPILLVLTWIFDVNRGGIRRTPDARTSNLPGDRIVRRVLQIFGVGLSIIAAALLGWWMLS